MNRSASVWKYRPQLVVHHPHPPSSVPGVPQKDPKYCFVAAHGPARGIPYISACLLQETKVAYPNPPPVYPGHVLKAGLHWVIGFPGLPIQDAIYQMVVVGRPDEKDFEPLVTTLRFAVVAPSRDPIPTSCPQPNTH